MDRTRGLLVLGNENANRMGWRFVKSYLGGPGRNRTTDTRIFNPQIIPFDTIRYCCYNQYKSTAYRLTTVQVNSTGIR
jgi:hypothetical protein